MRSSWAKLVNNLDFPMTLNFGDSLAWKRITLCFGEADHFQAIPTMILRS